MLKAVPFPMDLSNFDPGMFVDKINVDFNDLNWICQSFVSKVFGAELRPFLLHFVSVSFKAFND